MRFFFFRIVFIGAILWAPLSAQQIPIGEHTSYKLSYLSFSAASVSFQVTGIVNINDRPCYRLVTDAQTTSFFSAFYDLHNTYETFVDTVTGLPLRYTKNIAQKTLRQHLTINYDHDNQTAQYDGGKWDSVFTVNVQPESHTLFSALFDLRRRTMYEGKQWVYNLDNETEPWKIQVTVLSRENIPAAGKEYPAYKLQVRFTPVGEEKKRKHTDIVTRRLVQSATKLYYWIEADAPHRGVQIEHETSPFSTYTILTGTDK